MQKPEAEKKSGKQWSCKKPERAHALLKLYLFERQVLLPDLAKSEKGKRKYSAQSVPPAAVLHTARAELY